MPLVSLVDVSIRFRGPMLLDEVSCRIDERQRIGLLGRNGAGKSTLMKIIAGEVDPDAGSVAIEPGCNVKQLRQEVPQGTVGSVEDVVQLGVQHLVEIEQEWELQNKVEQIMSRMELDPFAKFDSLSSGMKRRVLLAQAVVSEPKLLLLDEPTNHLDIEAINWLENFLLKWRGSILFVTHDRSFLRRLATRILEIDRGKIFDWSCDYDKFLERKEAALDAEEKQNALFDKRLAEEEKWIRQGIKARRTRNMGRVRALKALREERSNRRDKVGTANIKIQSGKRSGNLVAEVDSISFGFDATNESPQPKSIVSEFSCEIMRGDKIGIVGPNGVGKTTLLRLLLGKLKPQEGRVRNGTNLEVAYFDQLRTTLDENETVEFNVADGYENIEINGHKKHVLGYLQDFLFPPERARTQVKFLSGGERNRLLLAKLFAKTANVLVMDEPTNDLDTETLELLEERLCDYEGTVLLVSHDRTFLNNVVTSTIVFENGNVKEYDGGYDDWIRQSSAKKGSTVATTTTKPDNAKSSSPQSSGSKSPAPKKPAKKAARKLSFKEKQELESLPQKIEQLEFSISKLHDEMASSDFYQKPKDEIAASQSKLTQMNAELAETFARWEALEQLA